MPKPKRRIVVDRRRYEIIIDGILIVLPPIQFDILALICDGDGEVISRARMRKEIWGHPDGMIETRTIDQHIHRLRLTLERLGIRRPVVTTVSGRGYKLNRFSA